MIPAALFHRAGIALFGDQYVAPLAVALGVEKNTVGKWRDGKSRVPAGVWDEIEKALLKRHHETIALALEVHFHAANNKIIHGDGTDRKAGLLDGDTKDRPAHGIAHGREKFEGAPGVRNSCATDGHYDPDNTGICILCCAVLGDDVT